MGLCITILLLAFYITKPFIPALLTGAIIAYLSYPLYRKVLQYVRHKDIASFIVAVLIVLLFTVPFVVVFSFVSKEAYHTYTNLNRQNLGTNFLKVVCTDRGSFSCNAVQMLVSLLPNDNLDFYLQATIKNITEFIIENVRHFLVSIPSFLLNLFVMVFVVYYLLKDGDSVAKRIKNLLPLKEAHKQHVITRFHSIASAVFYANISIALLQGVLGGIGFFFAGVSSPILWGFVMSLFALVPYFGTAIIWLPAALNIIFIGYLQNDNSPIIRGFALIVYGLFVISSIDNVLKPKLIGKKADVHPILVLLGVLGGLSMFGFIGLILGPVMLALLMTFVDIYEEEKAELEKYLG